MDFERIIAVGYSNGANIAANALLQAEDSFHKAILFHAMPAGNKQPEFSISHRNVFLSAGLNDPLITAKASEELVEILENGERKSKQFGQRLGILLLWKN